MKDVNTRTLQYFDDRPDGSTLPPSSLQLRALTLHSLGEDDINRGDLAGARARFSEAYRTTSALIGAHSGSADTVFAHAQSEYWLGLVAWRSNDRVTATRRWQSYLRNAQALASVEPGSVRSLMELGYAEGGLCTLDHADSYDLGNAERHCKAAIHYEAAALSKAPNDDRIRQDLANRYGWLAKVQLARKDYSRAVASRQSEIALMDQLLAREPDNAEYVKRRSWPDIALAKIWITTGQPDRAVALLKKRWSAFAPRLAVGASSDVWETGLRIRLFLALAEQRAGDHTAQASLAGAEALRARVIELFPERTEQVMKLRTDAG
jgi:tetratricopeptide (TPR) repeat protein